MLSFEERVAVLSFRPLTFLCFLYCPTLVALGPAHPSESAAELLKNTCPDATIPSPPHFDLFGLVGSRHRYFLKTPKMILTCVQGWESVPCSMFWLRYIFLLYHREYIKSFLLSTIVCIYLSPSLSPCWFLHSLVVSINRSSDSWFFFMTILTSCKTFKNSLCKRTLKCYLHT